MEHEPCGVHSVLAAAIGGGLEEEALRWGRWKKVSLHLFLGGRGARGRKGHAMYCANASDLSQRATVNSCCWSAEL